MNFNELKQRLIKISTTHICDVSKEAQVMDGRIHSMLEKNVKMVGYAFTVRTYGNVKAMLQAISFAKANHILIADVGGSTQAMAGDLMALAAKQKGLAGIVIDGACRDLSGIREVGLPFYAATVCPRRSVNDASGDFQMPLNCGEIEIAPDMLVFGDENGIVVADEQEFIKVLPAAEAALVKEDHVMQKLQDGANLDELYKF